MTMKSVICTFLLAAALLEVKAETNAVAFSAGLSKNLVLAHTEIVVYDRIFTNVGTGYDSNTGKFRCPTSGVYVFQFHSVANQDKTIWTELWHNGYYICSMYGHTSSDYASGGNSVVLRLTKGDEVYVKAVDPTNGAATNMYGASDEVYSTFSGYMVAPVYEEFPSVVG
ncbi:complement C1q-like protein 4 isoform X1 [Magallana gigas]|uniref:complement C1q-like protein 4 isoform X1 n=1 Tax=Magallana gigas TaxID=29159 RepID=UPI00148ABF2F|nr:complement C1q-like protein 4 isoform X1 [Crassostrea gigas]